MAREWNDPNDANLPASAYERDGIDRLFHPDPEAPLSAFGSGGENPFRAGSEAELSLAALTSDAISSAAATELAHGIQAREDPTVRHDNETDRAGPSERTAAAETAMFRGSFAAMWVVAPPTWLSGKWRSIGPLSAPAGGHNSLFRRLPCE